MIGDRQERLDTIERYRFRCPRRTRVSNSRNFTSPRSYERVRLFQSGRATYTNGYGTEQSDYPGQ